MITRYFRARAVLDLALGVLLLGATWDGLYNALDLPLPRPELYAQFAGAALIGFAYMLWIAPRNDRVLRTVALGAAIGNALATVILLAWLLRGDVDGILLWLFVPICAASALIEGVVASRAVAMLVPGD